MEVLAGQLSELVPGTRRVRRRPAPAGPAADLLVPATRLRHVRASRRNGVDQSFLTQGSDRAPGCGASDLIRLDKLTFGGDAGVRRVLAGQDPALDDRRYLPVGRYRAERVDPLSWHMINFRYCRPWSCGVIRCYTYRYVSAARGQYSRFPGDAAAALQRLEEEPTRQCSCASVATTASCWAPPGSGSARQIRCPHGLLGEISFRRFRRAHYRITI